MTEATKPPAVFLQWDSDFFQKRIGRVITCNMSENEAFRVDIWAAEQHIDCLYYLADGSLSSSAWVAENHGFHLMDLRVTYQIDLKNVKSDLPMRSIRQATAVDLPTIKQMAGEFHSVSRFFSDDHFERILCKQLYELWIERDFIEHDRYLWMSEDQGQITGYTSASIDQSGKAAEIGLVGVNPNWRGQGIGWNLQLGILQQLKTLGVNHVEVVTQGRNISAQNLYSKSGYVLKSIDLWYHKWY
jgi:dTDP-4-amino-4,6-dideoxy-D-galactose acyltransferase